MKYVPPAALLLAAGLLGWQSTCWAAENPGCSWVPSKDPEINRQVTSSFEDKFAPVCPSITQCSSENLARIRNSLSSDRSSDKYAVAARALASSLAPRFRVLHSTSINTAVQILKSGALLSVDEMVRRCIRDADSKKAGLANAQSDGLIGEQDVIFFELAPRESEIGKFGNVTLVMDLSAMLDAGYFTAFPMVLGTERVHPGWYDLKPGQVEAVAPLYRSFVFKGQRAYEEFLYDSAIQMLWQNDHQSDVESATKILAESYAASGKKISALRKPFEGTRDAGTPSEEEAFRKRFDAMESEVKKLELLNQGDQKALLELLKWLGQNPPEQELSRAHIAGVLALLEKSDSSVLRAYSGFPLALAKLAPVFTTQGGFWELKVPRVVSLSLAKAIRVIPDPGKEELAKGLESAIAEYATAHGRKFSKSKSADGADTYVFSPR